MAKNRKLEEIWEKAQTGKLSNVDLRWVGSRLHCEFHEDNYKLIEIIGKSHDHSFREKLESLIHCQADSYLAALAVRILCQDWQFGDQYVEILERFIGGVSWDELDDLRLAAISAAGDVLHARQNAELLRTLLTVHDSQNSDDVVRNAAFRAIWKATGRDIRKLIPTHQESYADNAELDRALQEARMLATAK
jgi:hypothetical protein